jgi:hypothetical protein
MFRRRSGGGGDWQLGAAVSLALLPSGLFALAAIYLMLGGALGPTPGRIIACLAVAVALAVGRSAGSSWKSPAVAAVIVLAAAAGAHLLLDTTYDGQEYHYDAIRVLADGWNPYASAYRPPPQLRDYIEEWPWPQHYPQAGWLASAVLVAAGLGIETAKLAPILLAGALFLGVFGLTVACGVDRVRGMALAAMATANPIVIVQLFTRMNDGQMALSFALTGLFVAVWLRDRRFVFALAAAAVAFYGLNLKFSAVPLFVLLTALILAGAAWSGGLTDIFRASALLAVVGVVGVVVLGFHPYVTNTLYRHHPFFPVMGEGAVDIMRKNRPAALADASPARRLVLSYFGPTSTGYDGSEGLKPPFTIKRPELRAAGTPDGRIAGFGPLFSGALLIAAGLGVWIAASRPPRWQLVALACAVMAAAVSLFLPEAWWARYVPQLWWLPVAVATIGLVSQQRKLRIGGWILCAVLLLDVALVSGSAAVYVGVRTWDVRRQVGVLAAEKGPVCAFLGAAHARLELLQSAGVRTRLSRDPLPASCRPEPLAAAQATWPDQPGYCRCSGQLDSAGDRSERSVLATASGSARHYSTSFDAIENPLAEGGAWINGGTVGLDWADVRSIGGMAIGTRLPTEYADPTAVLAGPWAPDQEAEARVGVNAALTPVAAREVELRLRTTIAPHSITGYEILCSVVPANPYLGVVRWNGPLNDFTGIARAELGCSDGDILKAVARGDTITVYKNGVEVLKAVDRHFTEGSPGIGFFDTNNALRAKLGFGTWVRFGFLTFSASDVEPPK